MSIPAIQAEELKQRLDAGENLFLLDVREEDEYENLQHRWTPDSAPRVGGTRAELDASRDIIALCQNGHAQRQGGASF